MGSWITWRSVTSTHPAWRRRLFWTCSKVFWTTIKVTKLMTSRLYGETKSHPLYRSATLKRSFWRSKHSKNAPTCCSTPTLMADFRSKAWLKTKLLAESIPCGSVIKVAFKNLLPHRDHKDAGISGREKRSYKLLSLLVILVLAKILEGIPTPSKPMIVSLQMRILVQIQKIKK